MSERRCNFQFREGHYCTEYTVNDAKFCPRHQPPLSTERTYSQSGFDRELALRVGIALEEAGTYIVRFDDASREQELFTGDGAYKAAREFYERSKISWNCQLFAMAESSPSLNAIPRDASLVEQHDAEIRKPYDEKVKKALADGFDEGYKEAVKHDASLCPRCEGTKLYNGKSCAVCSGTGLVFPEEIIEHARDDERKQLALREAVWREAAIECCMRNTLRTGKYIAEDIASLPSSTELLAQREKDAGARAYDSVIHMLQSMQICCVPNQVDRGAVISQVRLMRDDLLKESIGGVTYSPPVPPRSTDVAAPSGYSEEIQRDGEGSG
jgi:cytochrome c5